MLRTTGIKSLLSRYKSPLCFKYGSDSVQCRNEPLFLKRYIHTTIQKGPLVAIGNYSLLTYLETARRIDDRHFNKITLIKPVHFLDYAKEMHSYSWGQRLQSNSGVFIDCFLEIYPNHKAEDFIKCEQVQELRRHILHKLIKSGVTVISGQPATIEPINGGKNGYKVPLLTDNGELIKCFERNTKFLNWYSEFKDHSIKQVKSIPFTYLYKQPFETITDNIILTGDNLSAAWFVDHLAMYVEKHPQKFSKKPRVYYIGEKPLPRTLTTTHANRDFIDIVKIEKGFKNVVVLENKPESVKVNLTLKNNESVEGLLYCANGLGPALSITQKVRKSEKLTKLPENFANLKLISAVVTEENPIGSLLITEHLLKVFLHQTETILPIGVYIKHHNLPQDYHEMISAFSSNNHQIRLFSNILIDKLHEIGIELDVRFFSELEKRLGFDEESMTIPQKTKNTAETIKIMCETFKYVQNASPEHLLKFESILNDMTRMISEKLGLKEKTRDILGIPTKIFIFLMGILFLTRRLNS